ncbi:hypothetical protein PMAYCL1PPCAC_01551, partial [Pristionchus mayeri]
SDFCAADERNDEVIDNLIDIKQEEPVRNVRTVNTTNEFKDYPTKIIDEPIDDKQDEPTINVCSSSAEIPRPLDQSSSKTNDTPSKLKRILRRTCVVCHRLCNWNEMRLFTVDRKRRKKWVEAVRSTPDGRRSLMALLEARKKSYLCSSHFSPSDYTHTSVLRADAVPFFEDTLAISCGENFNASNETKGESVAVEDEFSNSFAEHKQREFKEELVEFAENLRPNISLFENEAPIKKESMEVKKELFDLIEQPIADIYCPSTGTSRSIDLPIFSREEIKVGRHTCVVCSSIRKKTEMHSFTKDEKRRPIWVNAVRSTTEGRRSLMECLTERSISHLCESHFSLSDFYFPIGYPHNRK